MFKKILATMLALFAAAAFAAVDVNKASQAELETVKGIGPSISTKLIDERKKSPFKDWQDMVDRVKGVGEGNAARLSAEGLTVNGAAFANLPAKAAPAARNDDKPMSKADDKKAATVAKANITADDKKADVKGAAAKPAADGAKPTAAAAPAASAVVKK